MTEDSHVQQITQFMMAHGCVKEIEFKKLICKIFEGETIEGLSEETLVQLKHTVNKRIQKYNIMLRDKADVFTNERYFALISTVDNEVTRQANQGEMAKTCELFKYTLYAITQDPRGVISDQKFKELYEKARSCQCKHRSTLPDHKRLLEDWIQKNWLTRISEDDGEEYITLGVRAVAELDVFIDQKLKPVCTRWRS